MEHEKIEPWAFWPELKGKGTPPLGTMPRDSRGQPSSPLTSHKQPHQCPSSQVGEGNAPPHLDHSGI
jgi:hypothetical protein